MSKFQFHHVLCRLKWFKAALSNGFICTNDQITMSTVKSQTRRELSYNSAAPPSFTQNFSVFQLLVLVLEIILSAASNRNCLTQNLATTASETLSS